MFRNIKYGIENLIKWFPTIWNDRDWDYCFLYDLLYFKLKNMEKFQRKYGHSVSNEEIANEIKPCIEVLGRLIEDDYKDEVWLALRERWGDFEFEDCEDKPGYSKLVIPGVKTEEDRKEYRADIKRCVDSEEEAIQKDLSLLFDTMKENIRKWWD